MATGVIDPSRVPDELYCRAGDCSDLDLVATVDEGLRGSRAEDAEHLLGVGAKMAVVERARARGYVVYRNQRLVMLGATDDNTASLLLWRFLAGAGGEVEIWWLTAQQNWAIRVAQAAGLDLVSAGAQFIGGREHPPGPWMPSSWYF
jgi:hypothetical protein